MLALKALSLIYVWERAIDIGGSTIRGRGVCWNGSIQGLAVGVVSYGVTNARAPALRCPLKWGFLMIWWVASCLQKKKNKGK